MAAWRNQLRLVWELYLNTGEATSLLAFIEAHPQSMQACGHEYPHLHRISDIVLNGRAFRVTRCFACGEELSFLPISSDTAAPKLGGVPYWLSGAKLGQWIEDESREDPEEDVDWEKYR